MKIDLEYVLHLAKRNTESLGFIPEPKVRHYARHGQILMAYENGEPCGFLIFGNGYPVLKVYQCCIQYDARRMKSGLGLVRRLIMIAERRGCSSISLWCADDLEANNFWKIAGFSFQGQRDISNRRGRKHNLWVLWLENSIQKNLWSHSALTLSAPSEGSK